MPSSNKNHFIHQMITHDQLSQISKQPSLQGGIIKQQNNLFIHLRSYHTFGRSPCCHSILSTPDISRLHMLICWCETHQSWYIQDRSTNGVWVNQQKLVKYQSHRLAPNDLMTLSSKNGPRFKLIHAQPPCDVMISLEAGMPPIYLKKPITIISDAIYFLYAHYGWICVTQTSKGGQQNYRTIKDSEMIHLHNSNYRLQINREESDTIVNRPTTRSITDLVFEFTVSEDEENIALQITSKNQSATIQGLRLQSQLYLLLCMARKSLGDQNQGYAKCKRGWINLNMLSKKLGITPENIRIRIHRLRNRLREMVNFNGIDVYQLIQLQDGDVRMNTSRITILRQNQSTPNQKQANDE